MPITYTIEAETGLLLVKWTGVIEQKDLLAFTATILADKAVVACYRSITDVRESQMRFTGEDMQVMMERLFVNAAQRRGKVWKTATVVADAPVQYGVARQAELFTMGLRTAGIFSSEQEARAWVLAD